LINPTELRLPAPGQRIEQRWFAGAHADVGGGYKDGTLSQGPLRWMQDRAKECGLQFEHEAHLEVDPKNWTTG